MFIYLLTFIIHKILKDVKFMKISQEQIEKNFIDKIGKITKQWGLGEPTGRVWSVLLFAGFPVSQRKIAEKTGYSLGLVSPSLKILEKLDMITITRGKGKEKLYGTIGSFVESFNEMMKRFLKKDIKPLIEQLELYEINDVDKKKNLNKLAKEYKSLEMYLNLFSRLMFVKKATVEKISKLIG